jgi:hypothetical protein
VIPPWPQNRWEDNLAQPGCRVASSMVTCTGRGIRRCKVIFCGVLTSLGKRSHESIKLHTLPLEWKGRVGTQGGAWEGRWHAESPAHTSWAGAKNTYLHRLLPTRRRPCGEFHMAAILALYHNRTNLKVSGRPLQYWPSDRLNIIAHFQQSRRPAWRVGGGGARPGIASMMVPAVLWVASKYPRVGIETPM